MRYMPSQTLPGFFIFITVQGHCGRGIAALRADDYAIRA